MHEPDGRRRNELIWRAGTQYVVQRGNAYWIVDGAGAVVRRCEPRESSVEDELWCTTYEIEDGELRECTRVERPYGVSQLDPSVELAGLVVDVDPETQRFIATALGDDAVVREEKRLRDIAAATARVDAIDGARSDFALGADFARAQHALVERVYNWGDEHATALLRTLVALARARASPAAIAAYVRGCLLACFNRDVPDFVDGEPLSHSLATTVADLARELEREGEAQEWADANMTAASYRGAARALREAARLLGG